MIIACQSCLHGLEVVGELDELAHTVGQLSTFRTEGYTCFHCGGRAECVWPSQVDADFRRSCRLTTVSPVEAVAALSGLGLPQEQTCCAEVVVPALAAHGIKPKVRYRPGSNRVYLDALELKDGTVLHLGPSPRGAVVYRVTSPHSYAAKELSHD